MGRFSDIDIEVRNRLHYEADQLELCDYDRLVYIQDNYDKVGKEIIERKANAARMVR